MLKVYVYASRAVAERAIAAIDAARHPDGIEELTLPDGTRERRPAKTWAHPIELGDGRFAVTAEDPDAQDVSTIEMVLDANGEPVIYDGRVAYRLVIEGS